MTLISERVTDIFGGVSQAPSASRSSSQWTELLNALPIFGKRLGRRPPLLHVAKLSSTIPTDAFEHPVVTSTGLRVHLVVVGGVLSAYDADTGASITVLDPDATPYLAAGSLKAISSGDTTVFLNTTVEVGRSLDTRAPAKKNEALIYVRQGNYSTDYVVTLGGKAFTYTTPDSGTAGADAATATDKIATEILALLQADATIVADYYLTQYGSTIYVARMDGADFLVTSTDGLADKGIVLVKGTIQRFADLPPRCRPGITVEVTGEESTNFDNYFVQYQGTSTVDALGVWKEVVKPGAALALDATSLPHQCVFRGEFMPATKNVPRANLLPALDVDGPILSIHWMVKCPPGGTYPAGMPITLTLSGVDVFTYTVGVTPEDSATVSAGLQALVAANATYTTARFNGEEFDIALTVPGFFAVAVSGGFSSATTFVPAQEVRTGLVGYTIKNLTDGSEGVITGGDSRRIEVASLTGGTTNLFNDNDECVVVSTGDYFLLSEAPWSLRAVGDDTTVPFPSVVGKTLNEVFFHQGRLGLTAANGVLLSRAGDLFNLFRSTATAILADDPIDIQSALGDTSPFHSAVEWNEALYLFSGLKQYTLGSGTNNQDPITPQSVRLKAVSSYQSDYRVRPVTAGNRLYFVAIKSGFTRVLEYTVNGQSQRHEAVDIGLHCPTYVEGNPLRLCVDESQGMLLLQTDGRNQKSIFVYSFRVVDREKVSGAWGRWDFACSTLVTIDCIDGRSAVLTKQSDGLFLNLLLLDPLALAAYQRFDGTYLHDGSILYDGSGSPLGGERVAYLDRRISSSTPGLTVSFSAGVTTWTLPFEIDAAGLEGTVAVCTDTPAAVYATTRPAANQVSVVGDHQAEFVYIGVLYTTSKTMSTLYVRNQNDEVDERGRLQLRFLRVRYSDSTDLTATVAIAGRTSRTTTLNNATAVSGTLLVPVQGRNDDVTITLSNGTPGAGHIVSYDWEGTYHTRERAI